MWKKLVGIISILLLITIICYQFTFLQSRKKSYENQKNIVTANERGTTSETVTVGMGPDIVTKSTKIIIESYDESGRLIERKEETATTELLGNNRLDMLVYANQYRELSPDEEREGLERMVLESFSPEIVTLVKYYGEPQEEQGYFIGIKDNVVIVYLQDRSQVYEYTNIEVWMLPKDIQMQLIDGIYVENEQELFDFLQTYSS